MNTAVLTADGMLLVYEEIAGGVFEHEPVLARPFTRSPAEALAAVGWRALGADVVEWTDLLEGEVAVEPLTPR